MFHELFITRETFITSTKNTYLIFIVCSKLLASRFVLILFYVLHLNANIAVQLFLLNVLSLLFQTNSKNYFIVCKTFSVCLLSTLQCYIGITCFRVSMLAYSFVFIEIGLQTYKKTDIYDKTHSQHNLIHGITFLLKLSLKPNTLTAFLTSNVIIIFSGQWRTT